MGQALLLSCRSKKEFVFSKIQDVIRDDFWLDDDTLQLIIAGKKITSKIPASNKRILSCQDARYKINQKFQKKFPKVDIDDIKIKIRYTLYTRENACKLIVWYTHNALRHQQ